MAINCGRMPDFLIIGGMKCGTTTLFDYLLHHPSIFMCENKEPNFFSTATVFDRGEDWYRSQFIDAAPNQLCGEASTSYSRIAEYLIGVQPPTWVDYSDTPKRIAESIPHAKLIYIMRHPVERAYSHYSFMMQYQKPISFAEAVARDDVIIETSAYIRHIERFLKFFPRDQMLFLLLDDLESNPQLVIDQTLEFLDIGKMELPEKPVALNPAGSRYATNEIRRRVEALKKFKLLRYAARKIPLDIRKRLLHSTVEKLTGGPLGNRLTEKHRTSITPLTESLRVELLDLLREPTQELERFLGKNLDNWYK